MKKMIITGALCAFFMTGVYAEKPKNKTSVPIPKQPEFTVSDAKVYGKQLVDYSDAYNEGWVDEIVKGQMTLFDAKGDSVRRAFTRMTYERSKKGDKVIIKFTSPAEIKGVSALTFENPGSSDDNWLYLPSTKRVRRISGANNTASFQGTEFTYEDLNDLDPVEYDWKFLAETTLNRGGENIPVYKIDAKPTYKNTAYSHVILYIHKTNWLQIQVDYYNKAGKHFKTRKASGWQLFHGRFWRNYRVEMENHRTGKRTLLELQKFYVDLSKYESSRTGKNRKNLKEAMFTTRAIK